MSRIAKDQLDTTLLARSAATVISSSMTAAATANTELYYYWTGSTAYTLTLPTAVSNTSPYKVKNSSSINQIVQFTSGQNADGSTSITLVPNQMLEFISDNTNYMIF